MSGGLCGSLCLPARVGAAWGVRVGTQTKARTIPTPTFYCCVAIFSTGRVPCREGPERGVAQHRHDERVARREAGLQEPVHVRVCAGDGPVVGVALVDARVVKGYVHHGYDIAVDFLAPIPARGEAPETRSTAVKPRSSSSHAPWGVRVARRTKSRKRYTPVNSLRPFMRTRRMCRRSARGGICQLGTQWRSLPGGMPYNPREYRLNLFLTRFAVLTPRGA